MLKCMFCGSRLNWQCDYDAPDMGYDCEGVIGCYTCTDEEDCGMFYEIIDLFPETESKDYQVYGERFVNLSALKYRASEEAFLSSLTLTEWYKINVHANSEDSISHIFAVSHDMS